jgi:hypothetical protein
MHFLLCSTTDTNVDQTAAPSPALYEAVGKLGDELTRRGVLVMTGSMSAIADGTRVRVAGGKVSVTDGPFAEAKELVGGWALVSAESKEEAIRLATQFQEIHRHVLGDGYVGETEIRPVFVAEGIGTAGC